MYQSRCNAPLPGCLRAVRYGVRILSYVRCQHNGVQLLPLDAVASGWTFKLLISLGNSQGPAEGGDGVEVLGTLG